MFFQTSLRQNKPIKIWCLKKKKDSCAKNHLYNTISILAMITTSKKKTNPEVVEIRVRISSIRVSLLLVSFTRINLFFSFVISSSVCNHFLAGVFLLQPTLGAFQSFTEYRKGDLEWIARSMFELMEILWTLVQACWKRVKKINQVNKEEKNKADFWNILPKADCRHSLLRAIDSPTSRRFRLAWYSEF